MCLARGFVERRRRATAFVLGAALLSWAIGDVVVTVQSLGGATPPSPSLADVFYLSFYPLAYIAVTLFVRTEVRGMTSANWLDGVIAGLGAAAVCAAFAFHSVLQSSGRDVLGTVANLAYPVGDVLLLGLVVGAFAVLSGRSKAPWGLLAAGLFLNVLGDTSNLFQNSIGASRVGSTLKRDRVAHSDRGHVNGGLVARPTGDIAPVRAASWLCPSERVRRGRPGHPVCGQLSFGRTSGYRPGHRHPCGGGDPPGRISTPHADAQ